MEKRLIYKIILILCILGTCVYFAFPLEKRINLGLDLKGGMHLLLKVDTSKVPEKDRELVADLVMEKIRNRVDDFGVSEPVLQRHGIDEIVLQLPGFTDRDRALSKIGQTGRLDFKLVVSDADKVKQALAGSVPQGYELKHTKDDNEAVLLEAKEVLSGDALSDAYVDPNQGQFGEWRVSLRFNPDGARKFAEITSANVGRRLAIVLDGQVQSAPNIKEAIPSGEAVITGRFTLEQVQDLAKILKYGALPAPIQVEEERTIGPLLGLDSIQSGVRASTISIILVLAFMVLYYFLAGFVADIALLLNLLMVLGGLGMLPHMFGATVATLTLPGIAGIILSLGMAVDANVLINERIREELNTGKSLRTAIANGYDRAFSAIFDSNLTTLIAAAFLFQFGTGPIRGFAVTLIIGLIASMFTAIVVTRTIFEIILHFGLLKSLPMQKWVKETKIDFIGKRKICYAVSLIIIVWGLTVFFKKGENAYGIDFSGGQLQEYSFKDPIQADQLRLVLKESGFTDAFIQQFKDKPNVVLIKTSADKSENITSKLKDRFPQQNIQVLRVEKVGPIAGKYLRGQAIWAIVWSLLGILVYVAIRFKHFNFAIAGVIALLHDVLVALGFMAITGRQIDLLTVTALLTIAGYSINDTIVIYDRVRENMKLSRKTSLYELINLSVNQTLARTILTSGVTFLTVIAIFIYGGEVLSNFAFALLVGFISGVYSTVYIASPLVLAWQGKKSRA